MRPLAAVLPALLASTLHAQVIGQNFTGYVRTPTGSFIPPDTMGAVGPNHFVELINGSYRVYDKFGVNNPNGTRTPLFSSSLNAFWSNAGVAPQNFAFDPRIVYDPFSQRFFAAAVDNSRNANRFLVAVSNSTNPLGGWKAFGIDSDAANQRWADFPTLGLGSDGLFLSANMFPISNPQIGQRTTVVALPKADLLAALPTAANARLFEDVATLVGFSAQPVVNRDNTSTAAFLSMAGALRRGDFTGPIATGTLTGPIITDFGSLGIPPEADQPDNFATGTQTPKGNIHTLDDRLSASVVLQGGIFWGIQTTDDGGRAALQWFKIRESDNTLLQSGVISDPNLAFYYGSIAVNEFGDVVIGASGSSATQFVSCYAFVGDSAGGSVSGTTTFGSPTLLKAGVDDYEVLDGSGRNRWGDYSATAVDPSDPFSFWTIQEFVSADNQYSLQVTQILIPEPASLSLIVVALGLLKRQRSAR